MCLHALHQGYVPFNVLGREGVRQDTNTKDRFLSLSLSLSLSLLEPGDAILTDQGFTIQVGTSQQLSRVRIHVELVIGLIKNKGQNTQREPYPGSASDVNIDEIHTICGALTKLYMLFMQ